MQRGELYIQFELSTGQAVTWRSYAADRCPVEVGTHVHLRAEMTSERHLRGVTVEVVT